MIIGSAQCSEACSNFYSTKVTVPKIISLGLYKITLFDLDG
jgi:hypothetical protein